MIEHRFYKILLPLDLLCVLDSRAVSGVTVFLLSNWLYLALGQLMCSMRFCHVSNFPHDHAYTLSENTVNVRKLRLVVVGSMPSLGSSALNCCYNMTHI